jgi:hypothetical protein
MTALWLTSVALTVIWLWNPFERPADEIGNVAVAEPDEQFVAPVAAKVTVDGKEAVEQKAREVKEKADEENTEAMNNAIDLFKQAGKEAENE